jgi:hypothetical protein
VKPRDPQGKFIDRAAMLQSWLPKMLDWVYREPIETMLQSAANWCLYRSRRESQEMLRTESDTNDAEWIRFKHARSLKWLDRRDILLRALNEYIEKTQLP